VVLVATLPVNASGKVLKRELRERHAAGVDHVVTNERSE
jgi:acyl-CoA synthetase (AMP-forming)/AMP-acid ligase II